MMHSDSHRDYSDFSTGEFINDPFFQDWILEPGGENEAFWLKWLQNHPEKRDVAGEARRILESIRFTIHWPVEEQVQQSLELSLALIRKQEQGIFRLQGWKKIAMLTGAFLLGTFYYLYQRRTIEQLSSTGYGTMQVIYLPDSSQIVLNAHSTLRYKRNWAKADRREVWLDGEAFFDVRHPVEPETGGQRYGSFLVHTGLLDVQVLGTSFDIRKRRGNTEVVLQKGKIKVFSPDARFRELSMNPGDMIRFDSVEQKIYRTTTVAENYSSWKEKKLLLTNVRLGEIIGYLEDNYGKRVLLQDSRMADRTIGGEVELDSLQDALFILCKTLDLEIVETDSTLIFQSK